MAELVEGYNMLIWENDDGTATYTGSFNQAEWDAYLDKSGRDAAPDAETFDAPEEDAEPEEGGDLEDETVDSLKEKLKERDLPVSGNKAELVERLREADADDSNDEEV